MRNASPYVGCEEEQMRKSDAMDKKNWLIKKGFKAQIGQSTTANENNFIKNYVTATPSDPPMLHKFR